jgi:DNA-binding NarL/FixJ family response regulator
VIRFRTASRRPVRVLLVDDSDVYAQTLQLLLEAAAGVELVGRARNGAEGVELAARLRPDVVLMDVSMPLLDGFEATERIRSRRPASRVVMLTSSDDPADRARARDVGACGYLTKESSLDEIGAAVATAAAREEPADVRHLAIADVAWA